MKRTKGEAAIAAAATRATRSEARAARLENEARDAREKARGDFYALERARSGDERVRNALLTPDALRERIADYARNHGAACAHGRAISEASWRPFRLALADLARRAGARDR